MFEVTVCGIPLARRKQVLADTRAIRNRQFSDITESRKEIKNLPKDSRRYCLVIDRSAPPIDLM